MLDISIVYFYFPNSILLCCCCLNIAFADCHCKDILILQALIHLHLSVLFVLDEFDIV